MKSGKNQARWDYVSKKVRQTAKDLMTKKLIPKYAFMYLLDPKMLNEGIEECFKSPFQEWACPECGIMVYGPRKWIGFHLPIHGKFQKREGREHEIFQMKFNLY